MTYTQGYDNMDDSYVGMWLHHIDHIYTLFDGEYYNIIW